MELCGAFVAGFCPKALISHEDFLLQKSISVRICPLILHIVDDEGEVDGFVGTLTFANQLHKRFVELCGAFVAGFCPKAPQGTGPLFVPKSTHLYHALVMSS